MNGSTATGPTDVVAADSLMDNGVVYCGSISKDNIVAKKGFAFITNITAPNSPAAKLPAGKIFIHISEISRKPGAEFTPNVPLAFAISQGRNGKPCAKCVERAD